MNHIAAPSPMYKDTRLNAYVITVSARAAKLMLQKSVRGEWVKVYFQIFPVGHDGDMRLVLASPDADHPVMVAVRADAWARMLEAQK